MNKNIALVAVITSILFVSGCAINQKSLDYKSFTFNWSDGSCKTASDCQAKEYGCGGGHIVCTNNTEKWKDMISTCEIVENHPSQQGYSCSCVVKESKCGWVK